MSVLIKGCPMPHGCATCPFCSEPFEEKDGSISYHCRVNVDGARGHDVSLVVSAMYSSAKKGELITMRPDWCPLVEVPTPHGRLVDLDAMIDEFWDGYYMEIHCKDLDSIPVIMEAEKEKEDKNG